MEEDAANVLSFMASNGLVANANKTSFLILNQKIPKTSDPESLNPQQIRLKIGGVDVVQEKEAKLLGITFTDKQDWSTQISGKNGVIAALNKRLFIVKKLKNHIGKKSLNKIVDGLFTSKITYGVQLFGKVRLNSEDSKNGELGSIQKVQNKMARFLNAKTLKDKIPSSDLLNNINMLSVNQLNAKIKIIEVCSEYRKIPSKTRMSNIKPRINFY